MAEAVVPTENVVLNPRRWFGLVFIAIAQLMVSVDATIINIALPSAQKSLSISDANRQWVVTAYLLAFGGLLLLGGRVADMIGRRRTFLIGLIGFAASSAVGGIAVNAGMLLGARALQGAFGALLVPASLALVASTFTEPRERAKAFGVFSAIAGSGAAVGLILGGVLTQFFSWRWSLLVNVGFAVVVLIGALASVHDAHGVRNRDRLDVAGTVLVTGGLVALVYGCTLAVSAGWTAGSTLGLLAAAVVLLVLFVVVESRIAAPLLPLRVVTERNRAGVFAAQALAVITMYGLLLFLTYYLQVVRGYSPLIAGVAFLPMVAGMLIGAGQIASRLMTKVRPRWLIASGFVIGAVGMLLLTRLNVDSSYPALIMPAELVFGLGLGIAFTPSLSLATHKVEGGDTGVASAMVTASQQLGGSIGTALLNTIAASATAAWIASHGGSGAPAAEAAVHGYAVAMWWTVGVLVLAALIVLIAVNTGLPDEGGGQDSAGPEGVEESSLDMTTGATKA